VHRSGRAVESRDLPTVVRVSCWRGVVRTFRGSPRRAPPISHAPILCRHAVSFVWRFDCARLHSMLNESERITSHLLFQRPKFEPSALNPARAHHRRFCVICVICVIASYRSKPNPQPRNDLRTIGVIGVIGLVICVIASFRSNPNHNRETTCAPSASLRRRRHCVIDSGITQYSQHARTRSRPSRCKAMGRCVELMTAHCSAWRWSPRALARRTTCSMYSYCSHSLSRFSVLDSSGLRGSKVGTIWLKMAHWRVYDRRSFCRKSFGL